MKYLFIALISSVFLTSCATIKPIQHEFVCYHVLGPIGEVKKIPNPKFLCLRDDINEEVVMNTIVNEE